MENDILKSIRNLLAVLLVGVFACVFFLFDDYRDKMKIKNTIEKTEEEMRLDSEGRAAAEAAAWADSVAAAEANAAGK